MIQNYTKPRKDKLSQSGVTLIECLTVLTVLAALIAAVATSFILTLKSYVGEYKSEAVELEVQRAAMEFEYYTAKSWKVDILDNGVISSEGNQVDLYQPDGTIVSFTYTPTSSLGAKEVGTLSVSMPSANYLYSTNVTFDPNATSSKPFWISFEGSIGYRWGADTPSGAVKMGGSTLPDI